MGWSRAVLTSRFNGEPLSGLNSRPPLLLPFLPTRMCPARRPGAAALRVPLRSLLPLTVLAAAALLAGPGRAHAGYVTSLSSLSRPHGDSFLADAASADADETGAAAEPSDCATEISPPNDNDNLFRQSPFLAPSATDQFGAPSTGAGSPPSGSAGVGASQQCPAAASTPRVDAPVLVGVIFLETASRRPPPFPSRLFRPPRLS
jgi:hypothetical protein